MISLFVLIIATLALRALGRFIPALNTWHSAVRGGLAVMFVFTGTSHFSSLRADLVHRVPPFLLFPEFLVSLSGALEILGAIGLLLPATRPFAGIGLSLLLIALLPANIYATQTDITLGGRAATDLVLRVPLQVLYLALTLWVSVFRQPQQIRFREIAKGG